MYRFKMYLSNNFIVCKNTIYLANARHLNHIFVAATKTKCARKPQISFCAQKNGQTP